MILIFLFLRNWRPTLTIFFSIPLSIITTFIGMYIFNYTFNLMTLGGLALGIGMLVDNSVVVIENTFRHLEEGADRITAAIKGASEVGTAITASTFTTMAVFLPMCLSKGIAGQLVRPLALTVCLSLLASLFVALTIVPMIASFIFRKKKKEEYAKEFGETGFAKFKQVYATLLGKVLENKIIVLICAFLIFVVAIATIPLLGLEFMPTQDDPMTVLQIKLPPGTPLETTNLVGEEIEKYERSLPETRHVMASIGPFAMSARGAASGMSAADVNEGMIMSRLVDKLDRTRSSAQVMDDIRKKCPPLEGATFTFRNMHSMGTGAEQTPVAIRIFGKDIDTLRGLGNQAQELIKNVVGLRDMEISLKEGKPELRIKVDREKAAQFGLSVSQIGQTLETAVMGKVATTLRRGGDEWDIRVRLADEDRSSIDKLNNITLFSPQGIQLVLGEVADISYEQGPVQITREDRSRKVTITADTFGRDMGSIIADIKSRLAALQLPSGYFIDYGGTYKDMQSTLRDLGYALIIALFLIYMIMAALFESLLEPFIVMFTQPLALIGVVFGLLLFGQTFSTPAFIGFIILVGVVVNNAIVMIDYINQLRARGKELIPAVVEGAATRLRPILITAITTILGVLPMAISRAEGSEMTSPLGIALGSGLLVGTFLTLFIVPCIYLVFSRRNIRSVNPTNLGTQY
jgi:HAE1 family hydrophobic/amphiphilic exporter-1